ncbi:MAG TPA: hypothetical protein VFV34_10995 [Blastocatellia bacterium]|nr:hypothetical protein [Blastocatellia bacterium]
MRFLKAHLMLLVAVVVLGLVSEAAVAQDSATGQVKKGGQEMGEGGKSLAKNTKKGKVAKGGKSFGKHVAHGSKHIAKGTAKGAKGTAKGTTKVVKKAVTP